MIIWSAACLIFLANSQAVRGDEDKKTPFTLEETLFDYYDMSLTSIEWISDTEFKYKNETTRDTLIYDVETNEKRILVEFKLIEDKFANISDYVLSPDNKYVYVRRDIKPILSKPPEAKYSVYSIEEKWLVHLHNGSNLQRIEWGPKGNNLIYVYLNNIYYISTVSTPYFDAEAVKITDSGIPNIVFNGVPHANLHDRSPAIWFSTDGSKLIYVEYNAASVADRTYLYYGTHEKPYPQYPRPITMKITRPGGTNPTTAIYYVDLTDPKNILGKIKIRDIAENVFFLYLQWITDNKIKLVTTNRVVNESQVLLCDVPSKSVKFTEDYCVMHSENKQPDGWIILNPPTYSQNGSYYITITEQPTADSGKFDHLTLFEANETWSKPLTEGPFDDIEIIAWDEDHELIYYTTTDEKFPSRTLLYAVNPVNPRPTCLSCNISLPDDSSWPKHCYSIDAKFSNNFAYVVITCKGPSPTMILLYKNFMWNVTAILHDGSEMKSMLEKKLLPEVVDYRVKTTDKFEAHARLFFPPGSLTDKEKKYPLIIYVYGAPGHNLIQEDFSIYYLDYLTTNLGIIYGRIDGRGSNRRGKDVLYAMYRKLGTAEIEDQIKVTKYLQENVPIIDPNRIGIWGWSYGGYAAAKTLQNDVDNVFKCGISVAAVSSFLTQESSYSEYMMGLPTKEDNLDNYIKADLLSNVTNLGNKKFYLIHGTGDLSVHFQDAMLFSKALVENNILFKEQTYADESHDLEGVKLHFYRSMTEFWKDCFNLNDELIYNK